jgi:TonB family protein
MNFLRLLSLGFVGIVLVPMELHGYGSEAFLVGSNALKISAVGAKGVRHTLPAQSYESGRVSAPWMRDGVKLVAPNYPTQDQLWHHTGIGLFRIYLDLSTGAVKQVSVLKSTGFATLDNSAVVAFRQSRWKPGRWKEIDVPVKFILLRNPGSPWRPPAGAVRLQPL